MKTISLELARRLKDAGFERESEYVWMMPRWMTPSLVTGLLNGEIMARGESDNRYASWGDEGPFLYPAYTFEEIWAMLPNKIDDFNKTLMGIHDELQRCGYLECLDGEWLDDTKDIICATEAVGLLLEWAINEGHVK